MIRFLNLVVPLALIFSSSLYGARCVKIPESHDIVTAYHLSPHKKNELYDTYVRNRIPGKIKPDNYHITLSWVKNVQPKDHFLLQKHLQKVAEQYFNSATFTVDSIKRYAVNRGLNGGLVLTPKANEVRKFKIINQRLHRELQKFNTKHQCNYGFHRDVEALNFEPHITVANTSHIHNFGINRDQTIKDIILKIKAKPFEVLHSPIQNRGVKKSAPVSTNMQTKNKKTRKMASKTLAKKKAQLKQHVKQKKTIKKPASKRRPIKKQISRKPAAKSKVRIKNTQHYRLKRSVRKK
jgi:2'-5' RNA ligase